MSETVIKCESVYKIRIGEALLGDESELLSKKDSTENTQF